MLFLALQLGKAFSVENLRLKETQILILVLSLIFPTIIARKRNASKGDFFILITNSIFLRQYQNFNDSYILWMSIMNITTLTLSVFCNLICRQFLFSPVYNLQETGEISSQSKQWIFIRLDFMDSFYLSSIVESFTLLCILRNHYAHAQATAIIPRAALLWGGTASGENFARCLVSLPKV